MAVVETPYYTLMTYDNVPKRDQGRPGFLGVYSIQDWNTVVNGYRVYIAFPNLGILHDLR